MGVNAAGGGEEIYDSRVFCPRLSITCSPYMVLSSFTSHPTVSGSFSASLCLRDTENVGGELNFDKGKHPLEKIREKRCLSIVVFIGADEIFDRLSRS